MTDQRVTCTRCKTVFADGNFNSQTASNCAGCGALLWVEVFPALFRNPVGQAGEPLLVDGESSCYYHPPKKAQIPCDACGRFLCALCDLEFNGQHLCPKCLETGKTKGKLKSLENHRILYDSIALWIAILPFFVYPFLVITGPIAIFVALRYWNKPGSIVRRTKIRSIVAILLGLIGFAGAAASLFFLFSGVSQRLQG